MTQSQTVTVRILDKDYHIACPVPESTNLERAAEYLDKKCVKFAALVKSLVPRELR